MVGYKWVEEMLKEIEQDNPVDKTQIELKEQDLDKIADRVITKLSEVSAPKREPENEDKETENKDKDEKENEE